MLLSFFTRNGNVCFYSMFGKLVLNNQTPENYTSTSDLGPVVQSIVSLTSSLRGQLDKAFHIFSSPGRSPGRAIVLPPALALAAAALAKR